MTGRRRIAALTVVVGTLAWVRPGAAQITLDGSLGPRPVLTGPNFLIGPELGQLRGGNLFHSFEQFNVLTGQSATFTGPGSTVNILSRVTGGSASTIDGLLRSTIPGAHLFLINRSGVMFGPHAELDIGGSLHVTTADVVRFADGGRFPASLASPSVLSMAAPSAFGFLGAAPAPITVLGSHLRVREGQSISLVGGDVSVVAGGLAAPGGRVAIVGAGGLAEAPFDVETQTPDFAAGNNGARGGQVTLADGASLQSASDVQGGRIIIRGGRLVATGGSQAQIINAGPAAGDRVGIDVRVVDDVVLDGARFQTGSFAAGRGGDITMTARSITIRGDSQVGALSFGPGAGGAITLAADSISVLSEAASILSVGLDVGDAGPIAIVAGRLSIDGGSILGRNVGGRGADVAIDAGRVALTGGGSIVLSAEGEGAGGSLTVRASESVDMSGRNSLGLASGLAISGSGSGPAGALRLSTPTLTLEGGVVGGLTSGTGAGADIAIDVGRATLTAGAFVSSGTTGREGGNVTFTGSESILIAGDSAVLTSADGDGRPGRVAIAVPVLALEDRGSIGSPGGLEGTARAGDIFVDVGRLSVTGGSGITSGTLGAGPGGTVSIGAHESVTVSGRDSDGNPSGINSLTAGAGDAGRVVITTPALTIDGGLITTSTSGPGRGGDLVLDVGRLTMTGEADLSSGAISLPGGPATTGPSGDVTVNAAQSIALAGPGTLIAAVTNNAANAGRIFVAAPALTVADGAVISAATAGPGRAGDVLVNVGDLRLTGGGFIDSTAQAAGGGGSVTVNATRSVTISGGDPLTGSSRLSSNSQGAGAGGDVFVRAPRVVLADAGSLQARSFDTGNAGNLTVVAGDSFRSFGGAVRTDAVNAEGGNILIDAAGFVQLVDTRITTSVQGGLGRGGNITVGSHAVVLDGSDIRADAFGGPGGNVRVVADVFLSTESVLSASSARSVPGVVDVQAPITDVAGSLATLPESVSQAVTLLREACRVRLAKGPTSSFVVAGPGGLPPDPAGLLPSPALEPALATPATSRSPAFSPIAFTSSCR